MYLYKLHILLLLLRHIFAPLTVTRSRIYIF